MGSFQEPLSLEERAKAFATKAHEGQKRKYTFDPYIVHPAAVVELVRSVPHDEEMLAAAWLHDVVEDCGVEGAMIWNMFGSTVMFFVLQLSDISRPEDGNRETRKALDREHTAKAHPKAKTVKLADLIDNSRTITAYDPGFAVKYMREKRLLLDNALREGDHTLWAMADEICRKAGYR